MNKEKGERRYFQTVKVKHTGIAFVDSTSLKVCHNIRIPRHRVFNGVAKRGIGMLGRSRAQVK